MSSIVEARVRELARELLTPAELAAWTLAMEGRGRRAIGLALHISASSVASRLEGAATKLRRAGLERNASGGWFFLEEPS